MFLIKDKWEKTKIPITSLRWSFHGTGGKTPDPNCNYAGMVMYDPGTFEWKESSLDSA
jgi:hypothetical protein